jgi:hypothetical protein
MGARTVAGVMATVPMVRLSGTGFDGTGTASDGGCRARAGVAAPHGVELSQNFFTLLFYLVMQNEALAVARAGDSGYPRESV